MSKNSPKISAKRPKMNMVKITIFTQNLRRKTAPYPSKIQKLKSVSCMESTICKCVKREKTPALHAFSGYPLRVGKQHFWHGPEPLRKNAAKLSLFLFPQLYQSKPFVVRIAPNSLNCSNVQRGTFCQNTAIPTIRIFSNIKSAQKALFRKYQNKILKFLSLEIILSERLLRSAACCAPGRRA